MPKELASYCALKSNQVTQVNDGHRCRMSNRYNLKRSKNQRVPIYNVIIVIAPRW